MWRNSAVPADHSADSRRGSPQAASSAGFVQLAYCSLPNTQLDAAGYASLVAHARLANARHGITGLLLSNTKWIIQWIEGDLKQVQKLWGKIENDSRHHSVVQLVYREQVPARLFDRFRVRQATSHDMRNVVREAVSLAQQEPAQRKDLGCAASILSILLDPSLSDFYGAESAQ